MPMATLLRFVFLWINTIYVC